MTAPAPSRPLLRTLIVDDEQLAIERLAIIAGRIGGIAVVGTAADGAAALERVAALAPDLVLLDMTMPVLDGLAVARRLAAAPAPPAVIFVTAHEEFAVEAFDTDAVDYVLKPVAADRLERAIERVVARRAMPTTASAPDDRTLREFWVPQRSELLRIAARDVDRIDAERDYVRLHVAGRSYLLLQTIQGLEDRLDPGEFIRVHRSTILRRDTICGLVHEGLGVWSVELAGGAMLRIGRTYLARVKAMAGR